MKATPENVSKIIHKYIKQYESEPSDKYEVIYRLPHQDCADMGPDFIRNDKSRAFFCFYRMSPEKYADEVQNFAQAAYYQKISVDDAGKINLQLNVVMPTNDGVVDTALMNELISHELMHAYRTHAEINQGHFKGANPIFDFFKKKTSNVKYTMTDRADAYNRTMPIQSGSMQDNFRWVGYILNEDELYANIAGIEGFMYENKNKKRSLSDSRGMQLIQIAKEKLTKIEQNAPDTDWVKCMKYISYLPPLKNETLAHFKRRWLTYYKNQLAKFDKKLEKLINDNKKDKFINATQKTALKSSKTVSKNAVIEQNTR